MWSKADIHIHTKFSDGAMEPEDVIHYQSLYPDIRVLAIADHNTIDGALRAKSYLNANRETFKDLDLIVGEEISSKDGHVLGLFLKKHIPPFMTAEDTVKAIHDQGGIAIAPHPFTHLLCFVGLEGVGFKIRELPFDGIEIRNSNPSELYSNYISQLVNRYGQKLPVLGSSDAHFLSAIGRCHTLFEGETAQDLRKAIEEGTTKACGGICGVFSLFEYLKDRVKYRFKIANKDRQNLFVDMEKKIKIEVISKARSKYTILRCEGRLDENTVAKLKDKINELIVIGGQNVIINMENVSFMDSRGIGALVAGAKYAFANNKDFKICGLQPYLKTIIEIAKLDRFFKIYDTEKNALNS